MPFFRERMPKLKDKLHKNHFNKNTPELFESEAIAFPFHFVDTYCYPCGKFYFVLKSFSFIRGQGTRCLHW